MAGRKIEFAIPLQSNVNLDEPSSLPSSPTAADADITMELPYATPNYSLAIQSKRALSVRNALVASKLSSCSVETLLRTIEANVSGGAAVEKDEFIEMVRILPELRSGKAFRPMEETLERIYRSFEAANRVDLYLLGIGCLPLIQGTVREKLHGAIKLSLFGCSVPMDDPISLSVLKAALACLLLSITAVFDLESATPAQLQSTSTIVTTSVNEAVARLFSFYSFGKDATVAFDVHVWPWIETNASKACPWLKLVDQQKWPTTKRLTSPTKSDLASASSPRRWASHSSATSSQADGSASALDSVGESQATTAGTSTSLDQPALSFRFSSVDGGILSIGDEQASKLFHLLTQSAFTKVHPKAMYDTFVQHTGDGLLEEETFLEAIEELLSMTNVPHLSKDSEFLDGMIDIFRCFLPENVLRVDAFEIAAGFSLFTWGSKSDKLGSAFHYFDADSKGFLNQQQLWRFLRSIVTILLYLSPPNAMVLHRHGSIAALVDTGEDEIMANIAEGLSDEYGAYDDDDSDDAEHQSDDDDGAAHERELANSELRAGVFTFEDFGLWYNDGGYKEMSWLELLDLRKWMFVSPAFDVDRLDVQPVDPVYASSNYYTANNIQVDVDGDNIDDLKDGKNQFTFAEKIVEEEDDDDDEDGNRARPTSLNSALLDPPGNSQSSFGSTASDPRSHTSSIPSTLPVFCLKNEVVLEFDLTLDADDDALPELPLTTLSFNNGDLLMYAELQRVTKLQQVDLNRVYEVFSPLMDRPSGASIEKSTFDECVRRLLPRDVAGDVVAAFGVHTNTRIPPPSVGRGNDSKMAADTLSRLFFAFNRGGTGKIDLVEFLSAFSVFCAGTKSQKLGYAYGLFDADHDGSLTRREMWKYLRSFLTMLLALGNGSELSAEAIASVADTTAIQIADTIFRDAGKTFSVRQPSPRRRHESHHRRSLESLEAAGLMTTNRSRRHENGRHRYEHRGSLPDDDSIRLTGAAQSAAGAGAGNAFIRGGVVSFQEFATWYSTRGHIIIAWIELLDTKKWPEVNPSVADAILRYLSRQQRVILPGGRRDNGNDDGNGARDSGSSNDTESSTESNHFRERRGSLDHGQHHGGYPDTNMTIISAADLRTGNATTALERMDGIGGIADLITSPPTSSSATIKDLSSVALQFKLMNFDSTTLRIRLKDVAIVYTISERMTLSNMKCRDLVNLLDKYAHGRTLTKQGYLRAMRELVPRDVLSNEDQEFLSFHLLRIYTLFETEGAGNDGDDATGNGDESGHGASSFIDDHDNGTSAVDKLLVLSGLSIFCGTTKSAKLGTLFKVFDTHGRGCVSRRHLFELLKSILVVLFAFSSYNANRAHTNDTTTTNALSTNSVAERAAGAVVSKIFCEATCSSRDGITLAEFAAWYAAGGYMDCPWLELLDLSKWPAKEAFEASKSEKHLICAFDLQDDANILNFTETDVSTYLFVLRSTNLSETSVSKIYDSLLAFATPPPDEAKKKKTAGLGKGQDYSYAGVEEDEGAYLVISRSNFYECIRSLVSKDNMTEKAQQTSSKLLSRIFNVFDRKRCGRVNALELACGMSILGKGSKSQKLALAFDFIARMRQQRTRTLNVYASVNMGGNGNAGGGGGHFGLNGGINSVATGGGPNFGLPSTRGGGIGAHAAAMRRTAMQNESNGLPHSVLFIYLRSFLLALMALSDGTYRLGIEKMFTEAEDMIEEAMGDLMTDVSATGSTAPGASPAMSMNGFAGYGSVRSRACVTFEQFGEWYNTGGCQIISWVELLDVSKWQQEQDFQEQTASLAGVGTGRVMSRRVAMLGSQRHGHYPVSTSTTPILEHVQPIENYYSTKPFTQRKQVRQSEIVSTSYATGLPPAEPRGNGTAAPTNGGGATKNARDSIGALSLCSDGPLMVFSVARKAAEIHFFHEDLTRLRQLLHQTQLPQLAPHVFGSALHMALCIERDGATAALVTRSHLIQSIEAVVCAQRPRGQVALPPPPASLSDDSMELLDQVLSVFVREPDAVKSGESATGDGAQDTNDNDNDDDELNDGNDLLEFGAAVCGLLVVCDGTLAAKLTYAAHLLEDGVAADDSAPVVVMETLKSALTCFLMAFYGLSSSLSAEVVRFSADLGAEDVLRSFHAAMTRSRSRSSSSSSGDSEEETKRSSSDAATQALDLTASVALREFSDWFSDAGYHAHPWLELTELQNWPAAMHMGEADAS